MQEEKNMVSCILSRAEEEAHLKDVISIAQENLERTQSYDMQLTQDLTDLLQNYQTKDKEVIALWNNTQALMQENKRDLLRCMKARKKPFFGRIDFYDDKYKRDESYYIGRVGIMKDNTDPVVVDWRAPVASVYYENVTGKCAYEVKNEGSFFIDLKRKRTYEIKDDQLIDFYDSDVVANDELLTKYLAKNKKAVLGEIIGTIQKEQNTIIRKSPKTNMIVQGAAGSGKTTVAMHRISYILYNYDSFLPRDFYIIGSNHILLEYITGVLPELDVYGVSQMTMERLFIRLMYEDWDDGKYQVISVNLTDQQAWKKGSSDWFLALEQFCTAYENITIPISDVLIEKSNVVLMKKEKIESFLMENKKMSMQTKINTLNEFLTAALETELTGKYISYSEEEKKLMKRKYRFYFGKDKFKGSIFNLYTQFLQTQKQATTLKQVKENKFDLYDLAALAYIYKRIKEDECIREATHIIIDEAQDFGMMVYRSLLYCLSGCTYTIMGDVSQNINYGYGLNDWEELKSIVLTGLCDSFDILKKSYRNTIEISDFATQILRHGTFPVYPTEPILRHAKPVSVIACIDEIGIKNEMVSVITAWKTQGYDTIAVICKDEMQTNEVSEMLAEKMEVVNGNAQDASFEQGVMVLPIAYAKGLEFDTVIIYDPSQTAYPNHDASVKLLYVAATRALHELCVLYQDSLTTIIKDKVDDRKSLQLVQTDKTKKVISSKKEPYVVSEKIKQRDLELYYQRTLKTYAKPEQAKAQQTIKQPEKVITKPIQFNDIPDQSMLTLKGHARIDHAIRWAKKTNQYMELSSRYGLLQIIPVSDGIIRVRCTKGQDANNFTEQWTCEGLEPAIWNARQNSQWIEVMTKKILVRIEKKTGAVSFCNLNGQVMLSENPKICRQLEISAKGFEAWNYFDWAKGEKIYAKGVLADCFEPLAQKARYISFAGKQPRMPLLVSQKGYGIAIASLKTVMCCNIPMYGQYIYTNDLLQTDYFYMVGEDRNDIVKQLAAFKCKQPI